MPGLREAPMLGLRRASVLSRSSATRPPCSLAYPHTFHRLGRHSMQRASRHSHRRQWEVVWPPLVEWVDGCTSTPITHSGNLMLADGQQYGCPPVAVR